jgi:phospholipase/carboxylesterase
MSSPVLLDGPRLAPRSGGRATGLVVVLHGYGADGHDLIGLARQIQPALPEIAFVAPHAPLPIEGFGRGWFELQWPLDEREIWHRASTAAPALNHFLDAELERHGLTERELVLVGFSQGAIMALHVGLRRESAPAAIVGYSGALVGLDHLDEITARSPVKLIHGDKDDVVPFAMMAISEQALVQARVPVTTHVARGLGHGIDPDGLAIGLDAICVALGM